MSVAPYVPGMPGVRAAKEAVYRIVFKGGWMQDILPIGRIIDGALSRDPDNTGNIDVLRAGMMMGKVAASGKYVPAIMGASTGAVSAAGTTINFFFIVFHYKRT